MDQSTLAGLGNWIVDEVLFMAGIHPERQAAALTEQKWNACTQPSGRYS